MVTRRSEVRVPRLAILLSGFQLPRAHSLLKVGRLLGCIGCNNAALSRELRANAHLFSYFFADRHDIQENETMKLM